MEERAFRYMPILTSDEISALSSYKGLGSVAYNCALYEGLDAENTYSQDSHNPFATLGIGNPMKVINDICNLYSAIYKMSKLRQNNETVELYRGTTMEDVEVMRKTSVLNKFLSTSTQYSIANGRFALPWKHPAILHVKVPADIPRIKYSSIVGLKSDYDSDNYRGIDDLNEKEVLIAPFCSIEIIPRDTTFWGKFASRDNPQEFDVKVSRMQLKEISPEEEEEGIRYLEENRSKCLQYAEKLLDYFYIKEQQRLQERIMMLSKSIVEMKQMQRNSYSDYIDEAIRSDSNEIKELDKKIKKLDEDRVTATEEVNKFKRYIQPICMSRCRAIEREIDLDYEKQKSEFIRRQNDVELQKKIRYKDSLVKKSRELIGLPNDSFSKFMSRDRFIDGENTKNSAYIQESYLNAIKKRKERIQSLSEMLGVPYYEYLKNIDEVIASNDILKTKFDEMIPGISMLDEQNIDNISNEELEQIDKVVTELEKNKASYFDLSDAFYHMQNNALLSAIYNKVLLIKSEKHENELKSELTEINSRSTLERVKDFFKRASRDKKSRAKEISRALPLIEKKKEELLYKIQIPSSGEGVDPKVVYDELNQMKNQFDKQTFYEIASFIENSYEFDYKEQTILSPDKGIALAQDRKVTQKEQMDIFLQNNGYMSYQVELDESNSSKNLNGTPINSEYSVDELTKRAIMMIQRNNNSISAVSKFNELIHITPKKEKQSKEMNGKMV